MDGGWGVCWYRTAARGHNPRIERDYQKGEERERVCVCDTNIRPKIHGLKHLDSQILLHLPDHFHGVVEREMGILFLLEKESQPLLFPLRSWNSPCSESDMFPLPTHQPSSLSLLPNPFDLTYTYTPYSAQKPNYKATREKGDDTHPVQEDRNGAIGVHDGGLAPQGDHFAKDADGLVGEGLEVFCADARCSLGGHLWKIEVGEMNTVRE